MSEIAAEAVDASIDVRPHLIKLDEAQIVQAHNAMVMLRYMRQHGGVKALIGDAGPLTWLIRKDSKTFEVLKSEVEACLRSLGIEP